jgi:ABC-type branched-subunit amino acid transport system permease subunit
VVAKIINPTSFTVDESIFILSTVIIGGMLSPIAANTRQIIYGGILVFMMWKILMWLVMGVAGRVRR